jgi:hypothetical protein
MSLPDPAPYLALIADAARASVETMRREGEAARLAARTDGAERAANRGERAALSDSGYLGEALANRRAELEATLAALERLAPGPRDRGGPGAILAVEGPDGAVERVLLAPGAPGGPIGAPPVLAVTPTSPLGRALIGVRVGDIVTVRRGGVDVDLAVVDLR